jgi:serine/threonine protein kinase
VWLAHDEVLESKVAVKVLAGGLIDDLDVRNRFLEEARILRRADSERLVRVHDIGELDDERPYFVMSYADLGTLSDRMRNRDLPVAEALRLAIEVALGVDVINRLGIIHRDLKPSNVLFQSTTDGGERLLIADLGLAKALAHASGAFTLPVGTPGYMSPEQARFGGGLDVRADVYGLGALTYHMLTGRAPGTAPVLAPPSSLRPELPATVDEVVMRALEPDRERRWPSAEAFAAALRAPLATARDDRPSGRPDGRPDDGGMQDDTARDAPPATERPSGGGEGTVRDTGEATMLDPGSGSGSELGSRDRTSPDSGDGTAPDSTERPAHDLNDGGDGTMLDQGTAAAAGPAGGPGDSTVRVPPPYGSDEQVSGQPPAAGHGGDATLVDFRIDRPREQPEPRLTPQQASPGTPSGGRRILIVVGLIAVLAIGGGGAYLVGKLTGTEKAKPGDGLVTVTDVTGRLSLRVPPAWKLQTRHTTWPVLVSDRAGAPAMRATPNYDQFVKDGVATPGVFAGLTHDLSVRLPPTGLGSHRARCTQGKARPYRHGTLSGQITPWACGKITISEVGLRDAKGGYALWVRIKQTGPPDLTDQILNSIRTKG